MKEWLTGDGNVGQPDKLTGAIKLPPRRTQVMLDIAVHTMSCCVPIHGGETHFQQIVILVCGTKEIFDRVMVCFFRSVPHCGIVASHPSVLIGHDASVQSQMPNIDPELVIEDKASGKLRSVGPPEGL